MQLTFGPRAKLTLVERHAMRRAEEVRQLLLLGRSASVTFEGVVQGQSETAWLVADIRVEVPGQVYRTAGIVPGMSVEVHGETLPEGIYLAEAIHLVGFQFSGPVLSLNSEEWTVGRYTFRIAADTWIEPGIQLGEVALVSVRLHDGGDLTGRAILRLTGAASPTSPTLSPEPPLPPSTAIPVDPTEESEEENNAPGGGDEEAPDPTPVDQGGGTPEDGGEEDEEDGGEEEEDEGEKIEIEGIVESQNTGYWVISGTTVFVDAQTEIKDNPQVGDSVKVDAIQFADGRIWAEKIEEDD
jgi:hypothetical protein